MNKISLKVLGDHHAGIDGRQTSFLHVLHVFYCVTENSYLWGFFTFR